jgi:hypothetical protein
MTLAAGLHCIFGEPWVALPERIDRLAQLFVDPRWPWQPALLEISDIPGAPNTPRVKGRIAADHLREEVVRALTASTAERVGLVRSRREASNHSWLHVDTGRYHARRAQFPYEVLAFERMEKLPEGKTSAGWLDLAHDFVRCVNAAYGVIVVSRNEWALTDELWLHTKSLNGKYVHPDPAEVKRVSHYRSELGAKYVRPARWGSYLAPAHVAAIGGRERIAEVVQPAILHDVGSLLYVQLSATVDDALTTETEAKRRAFADLLRPIEVPAWH